MPIRSSYLAGIVYLVLLYSPVVIAAAVVVWLGLRGKARWSSPYCRQCRYDLRGRVPEDTQACPECGADLAARRAVGFVRYGKRWSLVGLGVLLLLLPVANFGLMYLYATYGRSASSSINPGNLARLSNPALVQYVMQPANIDQPWGWREAANRIKTGKGITTADCDQLTQALTQFMKAQKPNGYDSPLHWQDDFFKEAQPRGLISDPVLFDFVAAYIGTAPTIDSMDRRRVGDRELYFTVKYGSAWGLEHAGLEMDVLHYPVAARIDGKPVQFKINNAWSQKRQGTIALDLPPGEHELQVYVDAAVADKQHLVGLNVDRAAPADWPGQLRRRWTVAATRKFTVLDTDEHPVGTVSEPAVDPTPYVHVKNAVVRTEQGQLKLVLVLEVDEGVPVPLAFDVAAQYPGGQPIKNRSLTYRKTTSGTRSGGLEQTIKLDKLDPAITTVDVTLTPNPALMDRDAQVTEVWGQPIVFKDVKLRRFDTEAAPPP